MREIKFRAWDNATESMVDALCHDVYGLDEIIEKVSRYSVMQYIGLKDKNGKEIYEGDICKSHQYKYWQRGVVTWIDSRVSFMLIQGDGLIGINDNDGLWNEDLEVIGNIYENPELLEKARGEQC